MAHDLVISLIFAAFSMLAFGMVDFIIALLARKSDSIRLIMWSSLIQAAILIPGVYIFPMPDISVMELVLAFSGGLAVAIGLSAFYEGLRVGKLSVVIPISNAWSIVNVFVGVLVLGEALNSLQLCGAALAILGTVIVSFRLRDIVKLKFNRVVLGGEYALVSMLGFGIMFTILGYLAISLGWYWSALIIMCMRTAIRLAYSVIRRAKLSFPIKVSSMLIPGSVLGVLALIAYNISSASGYISIAGPIAASSPFITVILGIAVLKERPERNQLLGILMIIAGIVLMAF